ncbi:MAG TPA: HAMP domain-containing histidine kinase [Clostridiaceae bacterium]|nr:HAMP domain-containing histidine kinase [Clostridiaceae bacterium]
MDTKLKKSKPFLVWLCFFVGANIIVSAIMLGIAASDEIYCDIDEIRIALKLDLKASQNFKIHITSEFDYLAQHISDNSDMFIASGKSLDILNDEGENLIYYAVNPKTGKVLTNSKTDFGISEKGIPSLPEGYDYYLYYNGEKFLAEQDGKPLDIYRNDSGYKMSVLQRYIDENFSADTPDIKGCKILLMVRKDIVENPYANSFLYQLRKDLETIRWIIIIFAVVFLFGVALLALSVAKWKIKKEFDKKLIKISGAIWFEIKLVISLIAFIFLFALLFNQYYHYDVVGFLFARIVPAALCCWWLHLMFIDLAANRRKFFSHNSINSLIKLYRTIERKKPFQKAMLLRVYALIATEALLVFLTCVFSIGTVVGGEGGLIIPVLVFVAAGIYLIYRYLRRYSNTINDIGKIVDHIEAIKNGDMETKLTLNPDADLYLAAENLNKVQEGISRAVEEKVRSERMKVELITNVSHDLKTPLTSIISYTDLLSKEENLPEHVKDYVKILMQKSERLKTLIQDIFDLSKATSGVMKVEIEKLDLGKLIRQTLADLDEQISQSGLLFRINMPDEPVYIMSDGKKLYRVFLNLICNALKYSLAGSRVYISLNVENNKAVAEIKNIANYEMNFKEDEVIERFVRGDKSRTTEGSGLGLAIAHSFTQVCGGNMDVKVDGDLFKVVLEFNLQ